MFVELEEEEDVSPVQVDLVEEVLLILHLKKERKLVKSSNSYASPCNSRFLSKWFVTLIKKIETNIINNTSSPSIGS